MQFIRSIVACAALVLATCPAPAVAHGAGGHGVQTVAESDTPAVAQTEALTGTVHELIVDDETRGTSQRYVELELGDGSLVALQGDATQALAGGAAVEVRGRRSGNALDVEASRTLASTGSPVSKASTQIDGTFAILHADNFAAGRGSFVYEIHHASGRIHELRLAVTPSVLEPGMQVRVQGRANADETAMTPDRITILSREASATTAALAKAATANSVLVIMANFNNSAAPAFSAAQVQQVMTSNSDSVANFFRETSYGQQLMNVTATPGWVTLNMAQPTTCGTTDWRNIGTSAEAAAKALGSAYDPLAYNFVVYVFPPLPSCGWSGLAYIGNPHKAWINGTGSFSTRTIAHEMGHNFGLLHAASLRCPTSIGGSCSSSEYGDPFDAMGNQRAMHYNAMQKAKLAWIPATSVKTHAGGSATYTLSPIETGGATTYAVKIPTAAANRTYWLEFRQPIGFDSPLAAFPNNGAQIRVAYPFETLCAGCTSNSDDTELLDMTPSTTSFTDATLTVGQTFSDTTYGISVTVLAASASALTVQVGTGGATPPPLAPTTTSISATPNPSSAGAAVTFTASVTGSAPTGSVAFKDNGLAIAGCGAVAVAGTGNVRSASCVTGALATGSHAIVGSYSGDGGNAASASTALTQIVNANTPSAGGVNVALASNGGIATASSTYSAAYPVSAVNDNVRSGAGWGSGGGWNDGTPGSFPDWVQISFNGQKTIDHVVVYTLQDNYASPVEPTDATTFSAYGITAFQVQGWNGTAWIALGSVSGNNLVKRTVTFAPFATDRVRVQVTGALATYSRITEIEAWTATAVAQETNVALASSGSTATASSTNGPGFLPSTVIDNVRSGTGWGAGGGWNDATAGTWPDWIEIDFNGSRTIDRAVVYSVQDNYLNPVEPTDSLTFSLRGITDFVVQGFDGANWVVLATVSGNNLVKRSVTFAPFVTNRMRIVVTNALASWSRITEIEAWGS